MAVTAIIEHGVRAGFDLVNESGYLITKSSIKGKRDKIEKKNPATRMVGYVRLDNPMLTIQLDGKPIAGADGALQGLGLLHPGNAATLANWTGTDAAHGFAAADNVLILFEDFTLDASDSEEPTDSLNFTVYPGIAAGA